MAARFDGETGAWCPTLGLTDVQRVALGGSLTIAAWCRANTSSGFRFMFGWQEPGAEHFAQRAHVSRSGTTLEARSNSDYSGPPPGEIALNGTTTGAWQHIVCVFQAGASALYVDGVLVDTDTESNFPTATIYPFVGRGADVPGFPGSRASDTDVAEFATWYAALGAEEAGALYRGALPTDIRRLALEGYWPLRGDLSNAAQPTRPMVARYGWTGTYTDHPAAAPVPRRTPIWQYKAGAADPLPLPASWLLTYHEPETVRADDNSNLLDRSGFIGDAVTIAAVQRPRLLRRMLELPPDAPPDDWWWRNRAAADAGGADVTLAPGNGALVITGHAPTLNIGVTLAPTAGTLTLTGHVPTLSVGVVLSPAAGTLTLAGHAPVLAIGVVLAPGAAALAITGHAPTVDAAAAGNVTLLPAAGALVLTGHAPTLDVQSAPGVAAGGVGGDDPLYDTALRRAMQRARERAASRAAPKPQMQRAPRPQRASVPLRAPDAKSALRELWLQEQAQAAAAKAIADAEARAAADAQAAWLRMDEETIELLLLAT